MVGFALGGTPIAVTLYAEFCTSHGRGRWLLLLQSFWTLGALRWGAHELLRPAATHTAGCVVLPSAAVLLLFLPPLSCTADPPTATAGSMLEAALAWAVLPTLGWRWLLALSAVPLLLLLALFPWLPESPYWLVAQRRYAEAEAVLQRVAAINGRTRPLRLRLAPGGGSGSAAAAASPAADQLLQPGGSGLAGDIASSGSMRARSPALTKVPADGTASPGPRVPLLPAAAGHPADLQHEQASPRSLPDDDAPLLRQRPASRQGLGSAARGVRRGLAVLFGRQLRHSTLLLLVIWTINALSYYGLVLLTTALQVAGGPRGGCTPKHSTAGGAGTVGEPGPPVPSNIPNPVASRFRLLLTRRRAWGAAPTWTAATIWCVCWGGVACCNGRQTAARQLLKRRALSTPRRPSWSQRWPRRPACCWPQR